jgi:hypothetical protein
MLKYLSTFFGGGVRRPARPAPRPRLGIERLDARITPSCGGTGTASGSTASAAAARFASFMSSAAEWGDSHDGCGGGHHAEHATLAASLTNATGATGTASFSEQNASLFVSVKGAAASTTLSVAVTDNGTTTTLGTVTTDASGNGHAKFTGATVTAGDTITVGDLNGTFAQVKFTASLTGATGSTVTGTASFNSIKNSLNLRISGADASTTYNVTVNGTVVGQITTNAHGRGHFRVTPSGVTIASASTITVVGTATGSTPILTGTFA